MVAKVFGHHAVLRSREGTLEDGCPSILPLGFIIAEDEGAIGMDVYPRDLASAFGELKETVQLIQHLIDGWL
jgi:hypothetical protein